MKINYILSSIYQIHSSQAELGNGKAEDSLNETSVIKPRELNRRIFPIYIDLPAPDFVQNRIDNQMTSHMEMSPFKDWEDNEESEEESEESEDKKEIDLTTRVVVNNIEGSDSNTITMGADNSNSKVNKPPPASSVPEEVKNEQTTVGDSDQKGPEIVHTKVEHPAENEILKTNEDHFNGTTPEIGSNYLNFTDLMVLINEYYNSLPVNKNDNSTL